MKWLLGCTVMIVGLATLAMANTGGLVSWDVLAKVTMVEQESRYVPDFAAEVKDLNGKHIELKGFMMPLDNAEVQKQFVLSASPVGSCFFCTPGGPESMVEINASEGVKFSYDTMVISGTFELVYDDPMGMFYRLNDAKLMP